MRLPIYLFGHPVLRAENKDVDTSMEGLSELIDNMFQTMYASEGVGLAAPQIGKNLRLVVIDADPVGDKFPECAGRRLTLINPEVEVLDGDPVSRSEGCLSVPGLSEDVKRVEHIRLTWTDENLPRRSEEMTGFLARIVQHECDHLSGVIYVDKIAPIRRQLIRNKLRAIAAGHTIPDYPYRIDPAARRR